MFKHKKKTNYSETFSVPMDYLGMNEKIKAL